MRKLIVLSIACLAALGGAAADTQPAETFRINLSPPAHVGDRFHYDAIETESVNTTTIESDKLPLDETSYSGYDFDGTVDVTACDAKARPARMELQVNSFLPHYTALPVVIESGTTVIAGHSHPPDEPTKSADSFALKDGPLHPGQQFAMRRVLTVGDEKDPTEQESFGPPGPIAIGTTWSLDGEAGAKFLARMHIAADAKHVTGKARLSAKTVERGVEYYNLQFSARCDNYHPALPANQELVKASATGELTMRIACETGIVVESKYHVHTETSVNSKLLTRPFTRDQIFDAIRTQHQHVVPK